MAGLVSWHVLQRGWGFGGRRNFLEAKTYGKKDNCLISEFVECGRKNISSKGCKGVVALEEHQVSESKKAKGKPREEVDDLGDLVDLKSQRVQ